MKLLEFRLTSEALCLGERIKKGTFRPTVTTIPYSQITGALRTFFGGRNIHAVGCIDIFSKEYLTYSPKNYVTGFSKLPITVELLVDVKGRVYVLKNEDSNNFPDAIQIFMGALRTRGLGCCHLTKIQEIEIDLSNRESRKKHLDVGLLNTRIPLEHLDKFAIQSRKPVYGYLFKPTSMTSGMYVLSLFEESEVYAPKVLLGG